MKGRAVTKSVKYPGKLGKPLTHSESNALALEAMRGARGLKALTASLSESADRRNYELLSELLDHYGIPRDDERKWFLLALEFAKAHVPAFRSQKRRGRPPKFKKGQSLADFMNGVSPRRTGKPGRKKEYTDALYHGLLEDVQKTCKAHGFKGRSAIKKALTKIISDYASGENLSVSKEIHRYLKYFLNRYYEAKSKFPEIGKKLPR